MVRKSKLDYIPEVGDVVWGDFDPTLGREQKGRRPAVVVSSLDYNKPSNLCVVCLITSVVKPYPFVVFLKNSQKTKGVVIVDQIKSVDWSKRKFEYVEKIEKDTFKEIKSKIALLLNI